MLKFDFASVNKKPRCDLSLRGIRMTLFTIVVILHYCGNRHSAPLSKIIEGEADAKVKSCAVDNLLHFLINKFFIFQSYRQWRITLHPLDANRPNSVPPGSGASRSISRLAPALVQSSTVVHSCTMPVAKHDLDSRCIHWMQTDQILPQPVGTYRL